MKKLVVLFFLVFTLLLVFSGGALAFPNMGPYSPQACDSCHGTGKMAAPLPEQLPAPPPPVSEPVPAPAPQPSPVPVPVAGYKIYKAPISFFGNTGDVVFVHDSDAVYVSLRSLASLYNTYATFEAGAFTLETADFSISGTVGQKESVVNGTPVSFENEAKIYEDRVFVCAMSLLQALKAEAVLDVAQAGGQTPQFSPPVLAPVLRPGYQVYRAPVSFFEKTGNMIFVNDGTSVYVSLRSLADVTKGAVTFDAGYFELETDILKISGRVGEKAVTVNGQTANFDFEASVFEDRVFLDAASLMKALNARAVLTVR